MRHLSFIDSKTFISGSINEEYSLRHPAKDRTCEYPDEIVAQVTEALAASMEMTPEEFTKDLRFCADQGRLSSPDDYASISSVTPSEHRVIAEFWLFFSEIQSWYATKRIKFGGQEVKVITAASDARTFAYINLSTGSRVVWLHSVM